MCPCPQSLIHGKCCHFSMRNHGTMFRFPCLYTLIWIFQCCNLHSGNQSDIAVEKKSGLLQFNDSNHLFKTKTVWTFPLSKYIPQICVESPSTKSRDIHPHPPPPTSVIHPSLRSPTVQLAGGWSRLASADPTFSHAEPADPRSRSAKGMKTIQSRVMVTWSWFNSVEEVFECMKIIYNMFV